MAKILIIDDSISMLKIVANMLTTAGHEARICSDAKTALQMAGQETFQLIITDIYMPEGDGLEVIRQLARIGRQVPVLAMSGMTGQPHMLKVAKLLGACRTLQKPFSTESLLAEVSAILTPKPPTEAAPNPDLSSKN